MLDIAILFDGNSNQGVSGVATRISEITRSICDRFCRITHNILSVVCPSSRMSCRIGCRLLAVSPGACMRVGCDINKFTWLVKIFRNIASASVKFGQIIPLSTGCGGMPHVRLRWAYARLKSSCGWCSACFGSHSSTSNEARPSVNRRDISVTVSCAYRRCWVKIADVTSWTTSPPPP